MKRVFFTQYTNVPPSLSVVNDEDSMTWQHCKDECDILHIVKKPNLGVNPLQPPTSKPMFGDFDSSLSFQEAQNVIVKASEQFADLPAKIRDKFENNPVSMLQFIEDPKNYDECISLGIFEKSFEPSELTHISNGEPVKAGLEPVSAPIPEPSAQ